MLQLRRWKQIRDIWSLKFMVFYFAILCGSYLAISPPPPPPPNTGSLPRLERSRQNGPKLFEEKPVESFPPETKHLRFGTSKTGKIIANSQDQRVAFRKGNRLISGKSRLVKFYLFTQNGWFLTPPKRNSQKAWMGSFGMGKERKGFQKPWFLVVSGLVSQWFFSLLLHVFQNLLNPFGNRLWSNENIDSTYMNLSKKEIGNMVTPLRFWCFIVSWFMEGVLLPCIVALIVISRWESLFTNLHNEIW